MTDPVSLTVDNGVATLTLNRPDERNALTREISDASGTDSSRSKNVTTFAV